MSLRSKFAHSRDWFDAYDYPGDRAVAEMSEEDASWVIDDQEWILMTQERIAGGNSDAETVIRRVMVAIVSRLSLAKDIRTLENALVRSAEALATDVREGREEDGSNSIHWKASLGGKSGAKVHMSPHAAHWAVERGNSRKIREIARPLAKKFFEPPPLPVIPVQVLKSQYLKGEIDENRLREHGLSERLIKQFKKIKDDPQQNLFASANRVASQWVKSKGIR